MSPLAETTSLQTPAVPQWGWTLIVFACLAVIAFLLEPMRTWPEAWIVPVQPWLTDTLSWLARDFAIGGVTLRDATRAFADAVAFPHALIEGVLYRGYGGLPFLPLPWVIVVAGIAISAHRLGGWGLAALCGFAFLYMAVFNLWQDAMRTLSIVIVAAVFSALLGLFVGIAMFRRRSVDAIVTSVLDVMQATPHLAYLAPIAVFFGFGAVPAILASAIFALPPMARCTLVGLRGVSSEAVEAARMAGCREGQLLWKVRVPASMPMLLVGLNQVAMQTLAMAVIASLVGATGLGHRLLVALQQLQLGRALENGIAIVLIAVVLDRLTQAWAAKAALLHIDRRPLLQRHAHLTLFLGIAVVCAAAAAVLPALQVLPRDLTITTAPYWNDAVRWISVTLAGPLGSFRDFVTLYLLIPLRTAFASLPWFLVAGAVGLISFRQAGTLFALINAAMFTAIAAVGLWVPAMLTLYLASLAVVICMAIGVPLGLAAAHRPRLARVLMAVCDTFQTFPSFIYLIPVIMLFRVGDLASLVAIIGFAMVPAIRYTYHGVRALPEAVIEAATACGTTRRQRTWRVEVPLATPSILLGLNQTILMALAMTAITALIGSRDLGQEILKALPEVDTGRGITAGLAIAVIGIVANRMVAAQGAKLERRYGMA